MKTQETYDPYDYGILSDTELLAVIYEQLITHSLLDVIEQHTFELPQADFIEDYPRYMMLEAAMDAIAARTEKTP